MLRSVPSLSFSNYGVVLSEQHIPAHRVVLAAASPYFRAHLVGSMSDSCISMVNFVNDIVHTGNACI